MRSHYNNDACPLIWETKSMADTYWPDLHRPDLLMMNFDADLEALSGDALRRAAAQEPRAQELLRLPQYNDSVDTHLRAAITAARAIRAPTRDDTRESHPLVQRRATIYKQQGHVWSYFVYRHRRGRHIINCFGRPQTRMTEFLDRIEDQLRGAPHLHSLQNHAILFWYLDDADELRHIEILHDVDVYHR